MSRYHIVPIDTNCACEESPCTCCTTMDQGQSWKMLETSADVVLADILPDAVLALGAYPAYITDNCEEPWDLTHEEAVAIVHTSGAALAAWCPVSPL